MLTTLKQWWVNHKTKALGLAAVMVTYAHQNFNQVADLFQQHPAVFHLCGYTFGLLAVVLGFINAQSD